MVSGEGVLVALASALFVAAALPSFSRLLADGGMTRPNYRGRLVPVAAGLLPAFTAALAAAWHGGRDNPFGYVTATLTLGALVIGLLDDGVGRRDLSGLRGHFGALVNGRLSTGAVKALLLPGLALIVAASLGRATLWTVLDACLIALSANVINLLDVRPGRAVKGVLLLLVIALLGGLGSSLANVWLAIVLTLLVYAPWDLRARAMLGDSGANAFGMAAGWFCALTLGPVSRVIVLTMLLFLQIRSEHDSLSRWIDRSPLLRKIDQWGRE